MHKKFKMQDLLPHAAGTFSAATFHSPQVRPQELSRTSRFSFIVIESGSATCEINFSRYSLSKNGLLILGNNLFHQLISASTDFRTSYLSLSEKTWEDVSSRINPAFFSYISRHPFSSEKDTGNELHGIMHEMIRAAERICNDRSHSFRNEILTNIAQNMLFESYEALKGKIMDRDNYTLGRKEELFAEFIRLVTRNSTSHRDVNFYADRLCITTRYLSSVVKSITGISPKDVIDRRCIQEIKMILRTTSHTIQETAYLLHFRDQSYLARYFRKHAGMSPAEYRKAHLE